jgi:hypothetical protein
MPTVLRSGPYRFFFYSDEGHEPPHIHVEREDKRAKFWLSPVRLHGGAGFGRPELSRIPAYGPFPGIHFDVPGNEGSTFAFGINEGGQVVGYSFDANFVTKGFVGRIE